MSNEGAPQQESAENAAQKKIENMVRGAESKDAAAQMLRGIAVVQETLHDPETGNDLSTSRAAQAVEQGNMRLLHDEAPGWLVKVLLDAKLVSEE